ncbi:hypothetical protein L1987_69357 [Smallanthus sonchifolius]|uniref:Uncharacterized protein n=1 Tax=Smallanthus sonchifolius TaxID=185202 RepID=A0ACB9B6S4_9ASTR|nr:hypothetical protein L1987_69357 [Smallanthus sonchifolius]
MVIYTEDLLLANDLEMSGTIGLMCDVTESASRGPPFLEKVEETAENDLIVIEAENAGKDSSGESMESCNSASQKNKRTSFEHELISTSKRLKKQSQECGVVKKHDSSFMNWISNMVKPYQQEEGNHPTDDKTLKNVVSNIFGFRSVFQSLYLQRLEETKTQMESSKEIILFDRHKSRDDNNSDHKPTASTSASAGWKQPVALTSSYEIDAVKRATPMAMRTCFFCGKTGHESRACLHINENKHVFLKKMKVSNLNQIASASENNKLVNQDKILRIPKQMFDTVRRLRLSRTDILKNISHKLKLLRKYLDPKLLVLNISISVFDLKIFYNDVEDENPSKGSKQPIRVNIGGVQCLVECRYISNCDFLEDELIAWWRTTLHSGRALIEEDLTSKLEEKKKLGLSFA